ncbi:MAG: hypothetical protein ACP5GS_06920 [Nitrososphaeria archaeon]
MLQALANGLVSRIEGKDLVVWDDKLMDSLQYLLLYRLNWLYTATRYAIERSLWINEYVYGFDYPGTGVLLKYMCEKNKAISFSVGQDGKLHYAEAEEYMKLGPAFTSFYLERMNKANVLEKRSQGKIVGCRIHERFDPILKLACPSCGSGMVEILPDGNYKCNSCQKIFSKPDVVYYCRENHAFDLSSSTFVETYIYSVTDEAKGRISR